MAHQLFDGTRFRLFTLVDNFTRGSLAIEVGQRFTGEADCNVLDRVVAERGLSGETRVYNGPEFTSKALDLWACAAEVKLDFSRPGKGTDNAYIESFNSLLRKECLTQHSFLSLKDAQKRHRNGKSITMKLDHMVPSGTMPQKKSPSSGHKPRAR